MTKIEIPRKVLDALLTIRRFEKETEYKILNLIEKTTFENVDIIFNLRENTKEQDWYLWARYKGEYEAFTSSQPAIAIELMFDWLAKIKLKYEILDIKK